MSADRHADKTADTSKKKEYTMNIYLIRHGKTEGNLHSRYIGKTDEVLCASGRQELSVKQYPPAAHYYVSPMKRCLQTLDILFPDRKLTEHTQAGHACTVDVIDDLRECSFGIFENKNYLELSNCSAYQEWIDSNGTLPFPGGEDTESFKQRCCSAFEQIIQDAWEHRYTSAAIVAHGGTIMSIMERYAVPAKSFYEWHIANGNGIVLEAERTRWITQKQVLFCRMTDGTELKREDGYRK